MPVGGQCGSVVRILRGGSGRVAGLANDVGLLTGALLGNFPQAFCHAALISAAARLEKEECSFL